MPVRERLLAAKEDGELVAIIYHGGSHPGKARLIYPTKITDTEIWGREPDAKQAKCFKLDKIELAGHEVEIHNFAAQPAPQEPASLAEGLAPYLAEIDASPYVVERDDDGIALYERFKNGNRRKHPFLSLRYFRPRPNGVGFGLGPDGKMTVEDSFSGSERPWSLRSQRGAWNFKKLGAAVARFLDEFRATQR